MIGLASSTNPILNITAATTIKITAVYRIRFASSCLSSPRLLATNADTATLSAKNKDNPTNLGCVVSPTAATASAPRELTIRESTKPAKAVKKDSIMAGHAMLMVIFIFSF